MSRPGSEQGRVGQGAAIQPGEQLDLLDELGVDKMWFHITRAMFRRGYAKDMGAMPYMVYCALKSYSNLGTGESTPSQKTIAEECGVSEDTVARSIEHLVERGYVRKEKRGRSNIYALTEKIPLTNLATGQEAGVGRLAYVPTKFQRELEALENFARTGQLAKDSRFHITLNVNLIQQGDNGTVNISQVTVADESPTSSISAPERKARTDAARFIQDRMDSLRNGDHPFTDV